MSLCSKKSSVSSANITGSRVDELGDSLHKESNGPIVRLRESLNRCSESLF